MTEVPEHLLRLRTESPMMPVQKMNVVPEELARLRDIGNLSSEPDYEALMKARGPVRVGTELQNTPVLGTIGKTLGVLK
jgi:hypothetical protein